MEVTVQESDLDCHRADSSSEAKRDTKKNNKPVMEKRRRAKINGCLGELKSLILDALHKDPARHSKLEKADILEMTVRHLQNVQRQQLAVAVTLDPAVLVKVKQGFRECGHEVARYVGRIDGVDTGLKKRLLNHVSRCVTNLERMTPLSFSAMASPGLLPTAAALSTAPGPAPGTSDPPAGGSGDFNNNGAHARLLAGLQSLMASRLLGAAPAAATSAVYTTQPPLAAPSAEMRAGARTPSAFERVRPTAAVAPAAVVRPIPIPLNLKKRALQEREGGDGGKRVRIGCSESSEESEVSDPGAERKLSADDMWRPW